MDYFFAETLDHALQTARSNTEQGKTAKFIAGGTDLTVQIEDGLVSPGMLIDLTEIDELRGIKKEKEGLRIGALTIIAELGDSSNLPACLLQGARSIGSPQIRNLGTIGGNICTASPCGDTLAPILALLGILTLNPPGGERRAPSEDFFLGPKKTALREDEILTEIWIDNQALKRNSAFRKIGKRNGQAISQVNAAVWLKKEPDSGRISDVRVSVGSVAPTPLRLRKVEQALCGKIVNKKLIEQAEGLVEMEISPISDVRAGRDYRSTVTRSLFRDALEESLGA